MRAVIRVLVCGVLLIAAPAWAQNHYTLTMIRPKAIGAAGTGLDADSRIYRANSGLTYAIRIEAIGGNWPYTYELSNAPAGMTVEAGPCSTNGATCTAGTITWVNPTSTASNIVATVRDASGATDTATWSITVSAIAPGAGGECVINEDTGNDTTGDGTATLPWRTMAKAQASCGARSILYLAGNGPFSFAGTTEDDPTSECYITAGPVLYPSTFFVETAEPVIWLDYPGDGLTPVLDYGFTGAGAVLCPEMTGESIWISDIAIQNCPFKCFENHTNALFGATYWRNTFTGTGVGFDGGNSAVFMFGQHYPDQDFWNVVTQNTFTNIAAGGSGFISVVKAYDWYQGLVGDNTMTTVVSSETVAMKSDDGQFTIRNNKFVDIDGSALGGNHHQVNDQTYGEIAYNNVLAFANLDYALEVNQDGQIGPLYVYRNTFAGPIFIRDADAGDGPMTFTTNVIVNPGGSASPAVCLALRLTCSSVGDATVIVDSGNNTVGAAADGIINADGELQGAYLVYLGTRGWQLGAAVSGSGGIRIRRSGS